MTYNKVYSWRNKLYSWRSFLNFTIEFLIENDKK